MNDQILTIDALDWDGRIQTLVDAFGGESDRPVTRAIRRAINKMGRWLRRQVIRLAASELGVTQKVFDKARVRFRLDGKTLEGELWVGTNPFPAHRLGAVRWTRRMRGARAGRRSFPGTFVPRAGGPVFRRTGKARLPIEVVEVEVDDPLRKNVARLEAQALGRYRTVLAQELNYELQKLGGNA